MGHNRRQSATWPFLLILLFLFLLTVAAPRQWEEISRRQAWHESQEDSLPPRAPRPAPVAVVEVAPLPVASPPPVLTLGEPTLAPLNPLVANQRIINPQAGPMLAPALIVPDAEPPRPGPELEQPVAELAIVPNRSDRQLDLRPAAVAPPVAEGSVAEPELVTKSKVNHWWPEPVELMARLDRLSEDHHCAPWAAEVRRQLQDLSEVDGPHDPRTKVILSRLQNLADEPRSLLVDVDKRPAGSEFDRARFALSRRLDVWRFVPELPDPQMRLAASKRDPAKLSACLAEVDAEIGAEAPDGEEGKVWRRYLLLDGLKQLSQGRELEDEQQRTMAQRVLARLERSRSNRQHRHLAARAAVGRLYGELRNWAAEPVDAQLMLAQLEQFEQSEQPNDAHFVATQLRQLAWSDQKVEQDVARSLETHYRNANLRICVSSELMNRLVPPQAARNAPVNDTMLGNPTRGWSTTTTNVLFHTVPDPNHLRIAVSAEGRILSDTETESGPVTLHSHADSAFVAEKELELTLDGIRAQPTEVEAQTSPELRCIETDLDALPVIRTLLRDYARARHDDSRPRVLQETRRKIRYQVQERMDGELSEKIAAANDRLKTRVLDPLDRLDLQPDLIEARSTENRLTFRARLASDEQLAGHAPRPQAPSNSLASIQIHQSLLNNVCEQLHWSGRTLTLPQIRADLSRKFNRTITGTGDGLGDDMQITFARENPIRVRCADGRIEVNLSIARLHKKPENWRDFVVRVYYKPDLSQPGGKLMRDGTVHLAGDRIGPRAQIALRGIFSKAFPHSRGFQLIPNQIVEHPSLAKTRITQFDIEGEWIGIALTDSVQQVAERPSTIR
jgi:hypothetical protein